MGDFVLVTGGAGAIGSNLVRRLDEDGNQIVIIDNLSSGFKKNIISSKRVHFIKGDIVKDADLKKIFSYPISKVFHLAANFANQNSMDHPERDLATNVGGTLKLLLYSIKHKIKKFIYASSSCVYGDKDVALKEEFLDFKHDTPYSISKLTGEKYVSFFGNFYRLKFCILRYFNVYGPGEMPGLYRNVIPNFFLKAMRGEPLTITGTGHETRDFTFVDDVVATTLKASALDRGNGMIFNVASGIETKILHLAQKINQIACNKAGIVFVKKRKWDRVLRRSADTTCAKRILGHQVTYRLDRGLERTYDWLKKNVAVKSR